ncbi:MAG TPA: hypothetical protein VK795_07970 [Terriglobales bacterium]|nr:hypothetical protein [Terriglobales bacterium]
MAKVTVTMVNIKTQTTLNARVRIATPGFKSKNEAEPLKPAYEEG